MSRRVGTTVMAVRCDHHLLARKLPDYFRVDAYSGKSITTMPLSNLVFFEKTLTQHEVRHALCQSEYHKRNFPLRGPKKMFC
jgi:hypothetical protein